MGVKRGSFAEAADKAVTKELRVGTWWRCDGFKIARDLNGGDRCIRVRREAWKRRSAEDEYRPLVDYPGLFLKFARLADGGGIDADPLDTDKNTEAALKWADSYGVLGLTPAKKPGAWWYDPRGGREDTVAAFAFEALAANHTLRLYGAATRSGGVDADAILELAPHLYRGLAPDEARDWALNKAAANVQLRVATYRCYPQLYQRKDRTFVEGYDFASLNAALWQQALWLLTADDVRRCAYPMCNDIIVYEQPDKPLGQEKGKKKPYKTRKDIEHCPEDTGRHCRVKHYRMKKSRR